MSIGFQVRTHTVSLASAAQLIVTTVHAQTPPTMRLDYMHIGNSLDSRYALERVVTEPLPWPGNPLRPIDTTNRGQSFFEVVDPKSGLVLYSHGFSTLFSEWRSTEEAQRMSRGFQESLRFPQPSAPVRV